MRLLRFVSILCTGSALFAPLGGTLQAAGGASAVASGSPADRTSTTRPVLVCFGDSLTAGYGVAPEFSYPSVLQQRLRDAGYDYRVVNAGVSGNTTKDGVQRLSQVLNEHPEVVVVEFGGNDGLRGVPVAESKRNLELIVQRLQSSGARVALAGITLPPQYGGEYIRSFNAMFPAVAGKFHIPLLPFVLQDVYGVPGDIQDDGIHPTAQGSRQVAVNIEHLVRPLLKKP